MKLVIGLGNPEDKYTGTRHNAGFFMLDAYAKQQGIEFQPKDKFKAHITEMTSDDEKVILLKPTTYYNLSGEAVRAVADFYKIDPSDILIVHDELALPFGTVRTRIGGSDAGNNGVKSITTHLGPDTNRIRIGIYNELRDRIDDADFVLSTFTSDEKENMTSLIEKVVDLIDTFIVGNFEVTTHK